MIEQHFTFPAKSVNQTQDLTRDLVNWRIWFESFTDQRKLKCMSRVCFTLWSRRWWSCFYNDVACAVNADWTRNAAAWLYWWWTWWHSQKAELILSLFVWGCPLVNKTTHRSSVQAAYSDPSLCLMVTWPPAVVLIMTGAKEEAGWHNVKIHYMSGMAGVRLTLRWHKSRVTFFYLFVREIFASSLCASKSNTWVQRKLIFFLNHILAMRSNKISCTLWTPSCSWNGN